MTQALRGVRPRFLSFLCVLGLSGCFLKMILVISPVVQSHGRLYAIYLSLSVVLMIGCLYGLWMMKKWAFWVFLIYMLMDQLIYWKMHFWDFKAFVLVFSIFLTSLIYYRRMS